MAISLKKIHHLIRYFVLIGIIVFVGYIKHWQDEIFLVLISPVLYLAYNARNLVFSFVSLPKSEGVNYFGFLMPVCIVYFGLLGFQLKQLWNERGKTRFLSLFALIVFVLYIHYIAWKSLTLYFTAPGPPKLNGTLLDQRPVAHAPVGDNQGQSASV